MQLTPGEGHDRLRRVDSNRKSRSFSKQPSTGDYYKNLSNDSPEPRGSRAMAPNEEVNQPSAFIWVVTQMCDTCEESDELPGGTFSDWPLCLPTHDIARLLRLLAVTLCKLAPCFHGFLCLHPVPN